MAEDEVDKKPGKVRRAAGSIWNWATTYDKERSQQQITVVKEAMTKERSLPKVSPEASIRLMKSLSFMVVIGGIIQYFLRRSLAAPEFTFTLSLILFVISGYALAQKLEKDRLLILVPMLAFVLWYFVFEGNYSASFLVRFLSIFAAVFVLPMFYTKGESLQAQMLGFIPVIFLFLDIGMLPWLLEKVQWNITPLLENMVVFMPWWALFGLYLIPEIESPTLSNIVGLMKIAGIVYIVFVFLVPVVPNLGYEKVSSPVAAEFEQAQQRLQQSVKRENPVWSNLKCVLSAPTDVENCVSQQQEDSEIRNLCDELIQQGQYSDEAVCFDAEKKRKQEEKLAASGGVARNFDEVTSAKFIDIQKSPSIGDKVVVSAVLDLKNPRNQELDVQIGCTLKKGSQEIKGDTVIGLTSAPPSSHIILGPEYPSFVVKKDELIRVLCNFPGDLEGVYDLNLKAGIGNLQSTTTLKRAFFKDELDLERWQDDVKQDNFRSQADILSQSPEEFARLNFEFGRASKDPFILSSDNALLTVSVENRQGGKVSKINSFYMDTLDENGFSVRAGNDRCLGDENILLPADKAQRKTEKIYTQTCLLDLPFDYTSFEGSYKVETFFATLNYDYVLEEKTKVEVKLLAVFS
ncbi:hypothetical protein COV20_04245 [Candidatus Woesearchaeota archaeon CG10_big_fil_rev_8_21_14_0_10_45_16]|nr:MAG: hypothetical protein COV20_04245 [Candidatus Woesearchaeota archaeon CG10_big_fil_rev_8_21_14_0_10_45_16]